MDEYELAYANKQADYMCDLMQSCKSKDDAINALYRDLHLCGQRAEQAEAERDRARYEATMEAARKVHDLAIECRGNSMYDVYSALRQAFNLICEGKK